MSKKTLKEKCEQLVQSDSAKELRALPEASRARVVKALLTKIRANKLTEMVSKAKAREARTCEHS